MTELEEQRNDSEELLDEESIAVLAILLAVSLEFGFGFAKTVDCGPVSSPAGRPRNPRHAVPAATNPCLARARRHLGGPDTLPTARRRR